ncbi:hypothetical protein FQA39_LY09493 [Lamprigera yunnana]|nr:hypothetical protein FQA39_LY09493 [Lamprigera yunnana]
MSNASGGSDKSESENNINSLHNDDSKLRLKDAIVYLELYSWKITSEHSNHLRQFSTNQYRWVMISMNSSLQCWAKDNECNKEFQGDDPLSKIQGDASDDEYEPPEKESKQTELIPLEYKIKIVNMSNEHPKWNSKTLQKKKKNEECATDDGKTKGKDIGKDDEMQYPIKYKKVEEETRKMNNKNKNKFDKIMSTLQKLTGEVVTLRREKLEQNKKINKLKKENKKQDRSNLRKKRNNIVILGMKMEGINGNNLKQEMESLPMQDLKVESHIKMARKLGQDLCVLELESALDMEIIIENKANLEKLGQLIYLNNDMTRNERERGNLIKSKTKEAKKEGRKSRLDTRSYGSRTRNGDGIMQNVL